MAAVKTLRVKVDRMAAEGQSIAKAPGSDRVVFVPYGVPGDTLEVALAEEKKRFANARLVRVVEPGPKRQKAPCPYHFDPARAADPAYRWCGGCDWQQFGYEDQLGYKHGAVVDCLRRIGRFAEVPVLPTLGSPAAWRYRNKVQVPFAPSHDGLKAGFYHPGTHDVIDFADCPVQPELSVAIVRRVKELAKELRWKPYSSRDHAGWLRHLFVRTNAEGKALAAFVTKTEQFPGEERAVAALTAEFPALVALWHNVQSERTSVILGPKWRKLWAKAGLTERIGRITLRASPGAFLQINTAATERLYAVAEEFLIEDGFKPDTLLDLYSGVGAIALWLAPRARKLVGVEEVKAAVEDAIVNARNNNVANAKFLRMSTEDFLRSGASKGLGSPLAAVLDPPRSGCEPHALKGLVRLEPQRIVYVSCNPATFARDARLLADSGYALRKVQPVDLFPQTSHIELVGLFDKK